MKQQHLLHDFLFMHTNTAIYTAVILKASQFSSACIQELKQLIPVYPDLQIGISSVQKAANIAELMKEAEFSVHVGLTLQKQQIILYPKVQLLRIIQELQQQDKTNYFQQTIAPLKAVSYTHLDVYKRQVLTLAYLIAARESTTWENPAMPVAKVLRTSVSISAIKELS